MRATVMYGAGDVRVEDVADARLIDPADALVRSRAQRSAAVTCGRTSRCRTMMAAGGWGMSSSASSRRWAPTSRPSRSATWSPRRFSGRTGPVFSAAKGCRARACTADGTGTPTSTAARRSGARSSGGRDARGAAGRCGRRAHAVASHSHRRDGNRPPRGAHGEGGPGKTVAVVGDGAVGLCGVIASKRLGAERILLLGSNSERTALGQEFGATDVVRERGEEAIERVRELTSTAPIPCSSVSASSRPSRPRSRLRVPAGRSVASACPSATRHPPRRNLEERFDRRRPCTCPRLHRGPAAGRARRPDRAWTRLRPHRIDRRRAGRLPRDERPRGPEVPDQALETGRMPDG